MSKRDFAAAYEEEAFGRKNNPVIECYYVVAGDGGYWAAVDGIAGDAPVYYSETNANNCPELDLRSVWSLPF